MNTALKGALLSGLIFPGLGQVVQKRYKRGAVIMLASLVSLLVVIIRAVQHTLSILEKIASEGGTIRMETILDATSQVSTASGSLTFNLAFLLLILCWIIGIVDAYRIGKRTDG